MRLVLALLLAASVWTSVARAQATYDPASARALAETVFSEADRKATLKAFFTVTCAFEAPAKAPYPRYQWVASRGIGSAYAPIEFYDAVDFTAIAKETVVYKEPSPYVYATDGSKRLGGPPLTLVIDRSGADTSATLRDATGKIEATARCEDGDRIAALREAFLRKRAVLEKDPAFAAQSLAASRAFNEAFNAWKQCVVDAIRGGMGPTPGLPLEMFVIAQFPACKAADQRVQDKADALSAIDSDMGRKFRSRLPEYRQDFVTSIARQLEAARARPGG